MINKLFISGKVINYKSVNKEVSLFTLEFNKDINVICEVKNSIKQKMDSLNMINKKLYILGKIIKDSPLMLKVDNVDIITKDAN